MRKFFILCLAVASFALAACSTTGHQAAGIGPELGGARHGGGVAFMGNGEKLIFDKQGEISERCQLCAGGDANLDSCKALASGKGIELCPELILSAPRGPLMCDVVYGPHTGTKVPFGSPGYYCWMVTSTRCNCAG